MFSLLFFSLYHAQKHTKLWKSLVQKFVPFQGNGGDGTIISGARRTDSGMVPSRPEKGKGTLMRLTYKINSIQWISTCCQFECQAPNAHWFLRRSVCFPFFLSFTFLEEIPELFCLLNANVQGFKIQLVDQSLNHWAAMGEPRYNYLNICSFFKNGAYLFFWEKILLATESCKSVPHTVVLMLLGHCFELKCIVGKRHIMDKGTLNKKIWCDLKAVCQKWLLTDQFPTVSC